MWWSILRILKGELCYQFYYLKVTLGNGVKCTLCTSTATSIEQLHRSNLCLVCICIVCMYINICISFPFKIYSVCLVTFHTSLWKNKSKSKNENEIAAIKKRRKVGKEMKRKESANEIVEHVNFDFILFQFLFSLFFFYVLKKQSRVVGLYVACIYLRFFSFLLLYLCNKQWTDVFVILFVWRCQCFSVCVLMGLVYLYIPSNFFFFFLLKIFTLANCMCNKQYVVAQIPAQIS